MASKSLPSTAAVLSAGLLPAERTAARKVLSRLDITCNERRAEHDIAHDECVLVVIGMDLDVMTRIVQRCKKALVIGVGVLASRPSLGVLASLQVQRTFHTRLIAPPGLPDTSCVCTMHCITSALHLVAPDVQCSSNILLAKLCATLLHESMTCVQSSLPAVAMSQLLAGWTVPLLQRAQRGGEEAARANGYGHVRYHDGVPHA